MKDSLSQQVAAGAGIPDGGTRMAVLVIVLVAAALTMLLLYFKMREADGRLSGE
jgi:hypothetical protein